MTDVPIIPFAVGEALLDWIGLTDALAAGHDRPKAEIGDTFLYRGKDTLLSRSAWIDGLGIAVKSATVFPGNPAGGLPMVNGGVSLYADDTGQRWWRTRFLQFKDAIRINPGAPGSLSANAHTWVTLKRGVWQCEQHGGWLALTGSPTALPK